MFTAQVRRHLITPPPNIKIEVFRVNVLMLISDPEIEI